MFERTKHESIVTAWAQPCAGPGWANTPVCVLVQDGNGRLRIEYIQPEELSRDVSRLYGISAAMHSAMTLAVARLIPEEGRDV